MAYATSLPWAFSFNNTSAGYILIYPGVQIKSVKGNTLQPDTNFNQKRPYLGIKAVPVHAQIEGCVPQSDQSRCDRAVSLHPADNTRGAFDKYR
jgi:hypothetical protein